MISKITFITNWTLLSQCQMVAVIYHHVTSGGKAVIVNPYAQAKPDGGLRSSIAIGANLADKALLLTDKRLTARQCKKSKITAPALVVSDLLTALSFTQVLNCSTSGLQAAALAGQPLTGHDF